MAISNEPPRIREQQLPPDPLPVDSYVMSYATRQPSNQAAVLSLVFGLLFFIPLAVPGIAAIVFGRRGIKVAREHAAERVGLARLGIILGVGNLALSLVFFIAMPFAVASARVNTQRIQCMANLRQIAVATQLYAAANKGFMPPTIDQIAAMLPAGGASQIFACPACGTNPAKPPVLVTPTVSSHYYYVPPAAKLARIKQAHRAVLAYEPPTHHQNFGMNVLFCDGHVELIAPPLATKIAAELAAGQNPPPSKP